GLGNGIGAAGKYIDPSDSLRLASGWCFNKTNRTADPERFQDAAAVVRLTWRLALYDARRDEEDQLLVGGADRAALEKIANCRDVAEQRHLSNVDRVLSLDHTTDHDGATVSDQHLGCSLLCDQSRVALNRAAEVRRGVFHVHVEEDRAFRCNLRNHGQS